MLSCVKGVQSWRGQVQVYTDNSVLCVNVILGGGLSVPLIPDICQFQDCLFPRHPARQSANSSLSLSNTSPGLVQWRAIMEPSFFSIAQSSGLLNPGQSVKLELTFKPAAPGQHSASLAISSVPVRGGHEAISLPIQAVSLSGMALASTKEVSFPSKGLPTSGRKPGTGTVSLENDKTMFQKVKIGATSIAKVSLFTMKNHQIILPFTLQMTIENRSGEDKVVEILPLPSQSSFQTVQSVVEVKNRCFSNIPINFVPHSSEVNLWWDGNIITAKLRGEAV